MSVPKEEKRLDRMRDFDKECARNKICECTSTNIDENASYKIIDGVIAVNSIWASIKKHIDLLKNMMF